jgi:Flp pilus assembly protein TadG
MLLQKRSSRKGAAAVELAMWLPFLAFLWLGAFDFCRVFYYAVVVESCARSGAIYGSYNQTTAKDDAGIKDAAANKDGSGILTTANITVTRDNDANPTNLKVSATYTFSIVSKLPWVPNTLTLTRTCELTVPPDLASFP